LFEQGKFFVQRITFDYTLGQIGLTAWSVLFEKK